MKEAWENHKRILELKKLENHSKKRWRINDIERSMPSLYIAAKLIEVAWVEQSNIKATKQQDHQLHTDEEATPLLPGSYEKIK